MINASTTQRIVITNSPFDQKDAAKETQFEMGGESHPFVMDGKVEDAVLGACMERELTFSSLSELTGLCQDSNGAIAKARNLIGQGAETVKLDVGKGDKWTAKAAEKPGYIEIANAGGPFGGEQFIRISPDGEYISLNTRPSLLGKDESLNQKVVGKWNAQTGTITCELESIEHTVGNKPADPLPKAPVTPPAPPRAGDVTTDTTVDAKVFEPVQKKVGKEIFNGLDDPKLTRFTDWALGQTDTPFGSAINAFPDGWERIDNGSYRALPQGDNYIARKGEGGGSYQLVNVDTEQKTVTLVTCHEYRQPGDFEGSHERVTLTRYADGEVRREFNEMHD